MLNHHRELHKGDQLHIDSDILQHDEQSEYERQGSILFGLGKIEVS